MQLIFTAIVLLIIAICATIGFKKGFLKTLVSMSALIAALILAFIFSAKVTTFIDEHTALRQSAQEAVEEKLEETFAEKEADTAEEQKKVLEDSWIPDKLLESMIEKQQEAAATIAQKIAAGTADLVVKGTGILVTIVVVFIIIKLLIILSGAVNKVPLVGGINKLLGGLLGVVRGIIIVWILLFFVTMFAHTQVGQDILAEVAGSKILSAFYSGALSFGAFING